MCEALRQEAAWLRAGLGGLCEEHSDGEPRPAEPVMKTVTVLAQAQSTGAPREMVRQGKVTSWGGWGTE